MLDRFVEADALLRQAQEHVLGLTAARTSAEASAAGLAAAAAAVSAYAETAKTATETTLQVQEQAVRALREAETLSRSFDSAQLLAVITGLQAQVTELQARTDSAALSFDARLVDIEQATAPVLTAFDALGRRVTRHTATHLAGDRTEVEVMREELRASQEDAAGQRSRVEKHLMGLVDRLEAGISTVQAREAEEAQVLSGIVDVLPRRSRRKLGR
ncbi:MAG: hypothetical protein H7233_03555 [Pseudorhodobacter sp.]|nr:hypothetical protein [Frankiaceae bacterium]